MGILETLRDLDRGRYIAALFAPGEKREALAAVSAYRAELARIPALVKEPMAGEIRLQWWRDVIGGGREGEAASHPVASALLAAITAHGLPRAPLAMMADGRAAELYHDPMPDTPSFEAWAGETEAAPIQLQAMILAPERAPYLADCAGHGGMVVAIARLIRLLPRHAASGRCLVPADLMSALGVSAADLTDEQARDKTAVALAALGQDHAARFRDAAREIPALARAAFLPVAPAERVLEAARRGVVAALAERPLIAALRIGFRGMRGW
jgi:15-cis-phytoene synthase